jgi:hypothetical protein
MHTYVLQHASYIVDHQQSAAERGSNGCADANYQVLQSFFFGRAFAITLSRRLGEAVVDVVSEVSKVIAENPKRVQEFQVRNSQQQS